MVWILVPKYYTARTTISDEYQETDIAIGLNSLSAKLQKAKHDPNFGINDIEVYAKVLETTDFANVLAKKQIPGKGQTYGQYLQCDNPTTTILDRIEYNIKDGMVLTVQLRDHDPIVASQMLDSTIVELQDFVTSRRHQTNAAALANAKKARYEAGIEYHKAQQTYAEYSDSHSTGTHSAEVEQEISHLAKEVDQTYSIYKQTCIDYIRQEILQKRAYKSFAVIKANTVPATDDSNLIAYILGFLIPALLFTKGWFLYQQRKVEGLNLQWGNLFSPWSITLSIWSLMFVGLFFFSDELYPISMSFQISISIWIILFTATSFATFNLLSQKTFDIDKGCVDICTPVFNVLFYVALLFTPLYLYEVYKVVSMFDMTDLVYNVRMLAIKGDGGYGILNYTSVINQALLFVALWRYPKLPFWKLISVIVCCIICSIAKMEKITFFMVFITVIYVLYERHIIKVRTIAILGVGLVFLFFLFNLSRDTKDGETNDFSLIDFICMYILSAPVAFGYLRETIGDTFCPNTLWVLQSLWDRIVNGYTVPHEAFENFVYVPISTNVYTILRPFYQDLGYIGVAYFALIYGVLSGYIYRLAKNGNSIGICLYGYIVFILSLQFFDEMLFAALSQNIQRTLLIILICQTKFKLSAWK